MDSDIYLLNNKKLEYFAWPLLFCKTGKVNVTVESEM